MLLAYYVHDLSPFLLKIGGFGLRWYGLAYLAGFVIGTLLYRRLAQRGYSDLRPDQVADFITMGALFGVLLGGGSATCSSTIRSDSFTIRFSSSGSGREGWPVMEGS